MFAVSAINTNRSVAKRMAADLDHERDKRREAQRMAWELAVDVARREADRIRDNRDHAAELASIRATALREQGLSYFRSYAAIERTACKVFKVRKVELQSGRRNRHIVLARQFVMYWACRLTVLSLPHIGRLMNGRDHTTVLHGYRKYPEKRAAMGRTLRALDRRTEMQRGPT